MTTHSIPVSTQVSHPRTTPSIAPTYPLSHADQGAQAAARGPVRAKARRDGWFPATHAGDSDPDMNEALRRATTAVDKVNRDKQRALQAQIDAAYAERADEYRTEYREYVGAAA